MINWKFETNSTHTGEKDLNSDFPNLQMSQILDS